MMAALAQGTWFRADRVRAIGGLSLLAGLGMIGWLLLTAHGTLDAAGRPLGTDFSNIWSAGRLALDGKQVLAWDWAAHHAAQVQAHGEAAVPYYPWPYPPPFLLIAAGLAALPYLWALAFWQGSTFLLAWRTFGAILPGSTAALIAAAAPVVLLCIGQGQNGFLTGALFAGGLLLLDRKPLLAGLLLGCLIYKPQFALALPVLVLAGGHWRTMAGAMMSSAALVAATLLVWGWPVWQAFVESLPTTRHIIIEQGDTGWEKIQSVFALARRLGSTVETAWAMQAAVTAMALAAVAIAARRANAGARNAVVIAAAMLATPYVLDYDLVVLGFACAFIARDAMDEGWLPWERTAIAFAWAAPLFARPAMSLAALPLGWLALVVILLIALRRSLRSSPCRR